MASASIFRGRSVHSHCVFLCLPLPENYQIIYILIWEKFNKKTCTSLKNVSINKSLRKYPIFHSNSPRKKCQSKEALNEMFHIPLRKTNTHNYIRHDRDSQWKQNVFFFASLAPNKISTWRKHIFQLLFVLRAVPAVYENKTFSPKWKKNNQVKATVTTNDNEKIRQSLKFG